MWLNSEYSLAIFAKENAEKRFKLRDLKGAIMCATLAKTLDHNVDGIDEVLVAYKIHKAAAKKHSNNGEINWYKVLGIREGFEDIEGINKQYKKMVEIVNPTKNASVATLGAMILINKAWRKLCDPNTRKLVSYSSGMKIKKKACPRCRNWCRYKIPKVSREHKHGVPKAKVKDVLHIRCSNCRCKFDPISGKTPSSRFNF